MSGGRGFFTLLNGTPLNTFKSNFRWINLEYPQRDEGRVVPPGDDGREERSEGGEAEAGAVHSLDAEALRESTTDDLQGESIDQLY